MKIMLDGEYFGEWEGTLQEYVDMLESMGDNEITLDRLSWHTDENKNFVKTQIAAKRYAEETKGIVVNGFAINTERESQNLITGAALSAYMDENYICRWKTPAGFVDLDAATLISVAQTMRQHVQNCFDREDALLTALEDGTYTEAMLDEGWPVNE